MIHKFFIYDGKAMEILNTTGGMILLNIMVLVFSLPVTAEVAAWNAVIG